MTPHFELLRHACGLSQREAAELLGVRLDTVKNWSIGRRNPPEQVLADLAALAMRAENEAKKATGAVPVAESDGQAQDLGWPCLGAQHAFAGRAIARNLSRRIDAAK